MVSYVTYLICLFIFIVEVCDALHPDLERNETVINTAVFNVCSSTRVKTKRLSKNLNTTQNTSVEDVSF
jgi:hypothetical protein